MTPSLDIAQDGNLFPREELLEAAAGADWRDQSVPMRAWVTASFGLALLAAGLPNLKTLYPAPTEFAATGDYIGFHPVHLLARTLGTMGLGIEATFFLISALCLGAAMGAIGVALRAFGYAGRTAFAIALLTCLSQALTEHARLPSDYLPGVITSALLLAAMAMPKDRGEVGMRGYAVRISVAWLLACFVSKDALALFPILVIACAAAPVEGKRGRKWIAPLVLAASFGMLMAIPAIFGNDPGSRPIPGAQPRSGLDGWITLWGLWPLALLSVQRAPEELPAPPWVKGWFLLAIGWSVLGVVWLPSSPTFVAPIVACIAANGLTRVGDSARVAQVLAVCLVFQLAATVTFAFVGQHTRLGTFAEGPGQVKPDDVILVDSDTHPDLAYLLRRRHGFDVKEPGKWGIVPPDQERNPQRILEVPSGLGRPEATHWLIRSTGEVLPKADGPSESNE